MRRVVRIVHARPVRSSYLVEFFFILAWEVMLRPAKMTEKKKQIWNYVYIRYRWKLLFENICLGSVYLPGVLIRSNGNLNARIGVLVSVKKKEKVQLVSSFKYTCGIWDKQIYVGLLRSRPYFSNQCDRSQLRLEFEFNWLNVIRRYNTDDELCHQWKTFGRSRLYHLYEASPR